MKKPISLKATNTDLRQVLDQLFNNTGFDFSIDPNTVGLKVGALKLKNVPFETALQTLLKAAGATYKRDATTFHITRESSSRSSGYGGSVPGYPGGFGDTNPDVVGKHSYTYVVRNVDPGFVVNAVRAVPGISDVHKVTQSTQPGKEIHLVQYTGTPEALKKVQEVAESVDVPWPTRAVEVKLQVKGTFQEKGKQPAVKLNNPIVMTPDNREATIEIDTPDGQTKTRITVLPKVRPDGQVWLTGSVDARWFTSPDKGMAKEVAFAQIQIDRLIEQGKPQTVASASTDTGKDSTARLEITAAVKVTDLKGSNE